MNTTLPERTADQVTLPNGDEVWVKTLNELQKNGADEEASWYAQEKCRPYRKGGTRYASVMESFRTLGADGQAKFIAGYVYWKGEISRAAREKYPDPPRPTRGEMDEEAFTAACEKWEQHQKKAAKQREDFEEKRFQEEEKKAFALFTSDRLKRCHESYLSQEFVKAYAQRSTLETLFRAVRQGEDHSARYFESVQAVEDAEDAVREKLVALYEALDAVRAEAIPIVPTD